MTLTKVAAKPVDDEDEDTTSNQIARISKIVMTQKIKPNNDHIAFLASNKTAGIPALTVKSKGKRVLVGANMHLQLDE